jgi:hypothetical protein
MPSTPSAGPSEHVSRVRLHTTLMPYALHHISLSQAVNATIQVVT